LKEDILQNSTCRERQMALQVRQKMLMEACR
jgi:hypothetical protein